MLDDRKLEVLKAIVTDYVSSQEPVGSKALVERHNLAVSPATVRNDMAALENEGYITQPHTSAGRIPTDKGYRLFVDRLATVKPLSLSERRAIHTFLQGAADLDDVVERTVRTLAEITRNVAIVQYPVNSSAQIRRIELVDLTGERVMVMVVSSTGHVDQRTVELSGLSEEELAMLRHVLNQELVGLQTSAAAQRLQSISSYIPATLSEVGNTVVAAVKDILAADPSTRVVVGGMTNLARFGAEFDSTVKPVLEALEEQVVLLRLVGDVAADASGDVNVRIGHENTNENLRSTSVVASGYGADHDAWAALGVMGPTRMDYQSTMAAVRAVARYVGRFLHEG